MWPIASVVMVDAYTDFILSRQAMNCTPATMFFYNHTAAVFLAWVEQQGLSDQMKSPRVTSGSTLPNWQAGG